MELEKALALIQQTAIESRAPTITAIPGNPDELILGHAGKTERLKVPNPDRAHNVLTLSDLIAAVSKWDCKTVWHDTGRVLALVDDGKRRDKIQMDLKMTPQYIFLTLLDRRAAMDQRALYRALKYDLDGCVGEDTMGASVERAVTGAQDIPEQIFVNVPIYSNPGEVTDVYTIRLNLDIDTGSRAFRLLPYPGELDKAMHEKQQDIHKRLEKAFEGEGDADVFYGNAG